MVDGPLIVTPAPGQAHAVLAAELIVLLAVEIVSPSSRVYDREHKRHTYLAVGVPEHWVVDAGSRTIDVWRIGDREPRTVRDRLKWTAPSGHRVEIKANELFEGVGG